MKPISLVLSAMCLFASAVQASEINGASCRSADLNERGLYYTVEIAEAVYGPEGEFYTAVNKYYDHSQRYPEVSYNGNSKLRFDLMGGKMVVGFSDRTDPAKFSFKIISGLSFSQEGEVTLSKNFKAKVTYGYQGEADAIEVSCIH